MIPEKLETCPECGCGDGQVWHYDFQRCDACGHGFSTEALIGHAVPSPPRMAPDASFIADRVQAEALMCATERELIKARQGLDNAAALIEASIVRLKASSQ